jgi:hypothetical protein
MLARVSPGGPECVASQSVKLPGPSTSRMEKLDQGDTIVRTSNLRPHAIGIGTNTALLSVVYAMLLRPFPYAGADGLVKLYINPLKHRRQRVFRLPSGCQGRCAACPQHTRFCGIPGPAHQRGQRWMAYTRPSSLASGTAGSASTGSDCGWTSGRGRARRLISRSGCRGPSGPDACSL